MMKPLARARSRASRLTCMTNTRTLRVKTPGDLLAMVPYLLGFHPEESVVLLTLGDSAGRFHARVDLPQDPDEVPVMVEMLTDAVARNAIRRVLVVVYTGDDVIAEQAFGPLHAALERGGVSVREAIRADGLRWYSMTGCQDPCCPAEGTPYDVSSHPLTAQAVLEGQVTLPTRQALADSLIGNDPDEIESVERAAEGYVRALLAAARHPLGPPAPEGPSRLLVQEGHWVGQRVRAFLADGVRLDHDEAGRLLTALTAIEVRDVAWAEMTRNNAGRHVDLWSDLVRRAPHELLAPPAALLGFAAWLAGNGALAWCAVERCQEAQPDYRLAGLLTQALAGAVSPEAWRPVPKSDLSLFAS